MREYDIHLGPYTYHLVFVYGLETRNQIYPHNRQIHIDATLVERAMNTDDPNAISDLYFELFQSVLYCVAAENGIELEQPDRATLANGLTEMWGQIAESLAEWTEEVEEADGEIAGELN